jgi:hypothetical protein
LVVGKQVGAGSHQLCQPLQGAGFAVRDCPAVRLASVGVGNHKRLTRGFVPFNPPACVVIAVPALQLSPSGKRAFNSEQGFPFGVIKSEAGKGIGKAGVVFGLAFCHCFEGLKLIGKGD